LASKNRRFCNYLIDLAVFYLFALLIGGILGVAGLVDWLVELKGFGEMLFTYVLYLAYYLMFEGIWARSPAKLITRTRVVTLDGDAPSFMHIVKRSCARIIPFEPLSFLGKGDEGGWHDTLSDTRVVLIARR
jgi:uncharacterized RDD family membrane protein YckC